MYCTLHNLLNLKSSTRVEKESKFFAWVVIPEGSSLSPRTLGMQSLSFSFPPPPTPSMHPSLSSHTRLPSHSSSSSSSPTDTPPTRLRPIGQVGSLGNPIILKGALPPQYIKTNIDRKICDPTCCNSRNYHCWPFLRIQQPWKKMYHKPHKISNFKSLQVLLFGHCCILHCKDQIHLIKWQDQTISRGFILISHSESVGRRSWTNLIVHLFCPFRKHWQHHIFPCIQWIVK